MNTAAYNNHSLYELKRRNIKRRREQELRNHILIFILSVLLFTVLLTLVFSVKSHASSEEEHLYKSYISVEIQPGDTLSSLSRSYVSGEYSSNDLMMEIMFINNLSKDSVLKSGNYLVIPYYDTFKG